MSKLAFRPESYNITEDKTQTIKNISFQKIDLLTNQIYVTDPNTIFRFGEHVIEEILKNTDMILLSLGMKEFDEKAGMLSEIYQNAGEVSKTFSRFIKELKEISDSYRKIDKCFQRYPDIDQLLNQFFSQTNAWFQESETMFELCERLFHDTVVRYHDLLAYILAAKQGLKEIQNAIEETHDEQLLNQLHHASENLKERSKKLALAEQFAADFIVSMKKIILKYYEFRQKQKQLIRSNIPVFRHMYTQITFSARQQVIKTTDPDAYIAEGIAIHAESLDNQWQAIGISLKELQWIKNGIRQEHEKNMTDLKALKNDFNSKRT